MSFKIWDARRLFAAIVMFAAVALPTVAHGALAFNVGGTWDTVDRQNAAIAAMQLVVNRFNAYGDFGNYNIYVYYSSGIPTAQASYLGSIGFGGTWPNERVSEHEACHYLGTGTYSAWSGLMVGGQWQGTAAKTLLQQFDGIGSVLYGDGAHFWPYGLNYDNEGSEINKARCVAMVYAFRQDMGIGSTAAPSTATNVTLTADDAVGESGFNYATKWSDTHFAHSGANYYTGNYAIRTPASSNSFNFVGNSLTINNTGDSSKGLFFMGSGSTGVTTFKNLILDGGTIHHYGGSSALFQLAGKVTVASASTINSEQGNTNILANLTGNGTLTIGTTSSYFVKLLSSSNTFTGNINITGRFELADGANQKFVIGASGVNNTITGATANLVRLNGIFDPDLTNASTNIGDYWTLVTAVNRSYGTTFGVNGFTENSAGLLWSNGNGYEFSESTSRLTVVPKPYTVAWSGGASANWDGGTNWNAALPVNGDKLIFSEAGSSGTTLTDNLMTPGTYNVSDLTFTSAAPAYTINPGTAGTNGFTLTGAMTNNSTNLQTINDAISLPNGAPKTRTFATTAGGGDITLGGNISGLGGVGKTGAGTLTLSGSNTYTGGTRVDAGTLLLTGTLSSSGALAVGGGTFTYARPTTATQTFAGLTVDAGASTINNTISANTLVLGAITRKTGGTVDFATITGAITTTAANTNGILGPWAFVGTGASTLYAYSNSGTIAGYTGATVESGTGAFGGIPAGDTSTINYNVTSSGTFASMGSWRNVNTIDYSGSGAATQPAANNTWLTINGLMNTGTGNLTIGGSSPRIDVVIGSNRDLVVATMTSNIVINNNILDNSSGESAMTKVGSGTLILNGANTYTGTTTIGGGTLQIGSGSTGASLASPAIKNSGALVFNYSNSLTYAGAISGTGTVTKVGAGTLTLSGQNTYSGHTTITAGVLKIGVPPVVAHRWSFNNNLLDSVGTSNASIVEVGANNVTLSSTEATLTGGASGSSDYIQLGSNLLPNSNEPIAIELWTTPRSLQNWSRIFDFGSSSTENLFMGWTIGTTLASDRVEWKDGATNTSDNTNQPYNLNTEYHIAMVLKPVGSSTEVTWYSAPSGSASLGPAKGSFVTDNNLAGFLDSYDNLGRSSYTADNTANASYNEVRIWNGTVNSDILETLHTAGSDADINSLISGDLAAAYTGKITSAVIISSAGAALDLNNTIQTIGSLSGIAGSSVMLGSGTLTVGTDNTSTTFSGVISGSGGVIKSGTGDLTLQGNSTYTGATNITQGRLIIDGGDLADISTVNVSNGASLDVISGAPILGDVAGAGSTSVTGTGTVLTVKSLVQSKLTLGAGAKLVLAASTSSQLNAGDLQPVPEPQTYIMLLIALATAAWFKKTIR